MPGRETIPRDAPAYWGTIADQINSMNQEVYGLINEGNFVLVDGLDKLPAAVGGVIEPEDGKVYKVIVPLDLMGARLENLTGIYSIIGTTSETSSITSTGLSGAALITARHSLPMQNISLTAPTGASLFDLDGDGDSSAALDWKAVNIVNTDDIGTIKNYTNFIAESGAIINSIGMVVDGTTGTTGFTGYFMLGRDTGTIITVPATATFTRRFRIQDSSVISFPGGESINFSTSAIVPDDSYILKNVNFSGGGAHTVGVQYNDNKADFDSKGVPKSATIAHATMIGNATATTISAEDTRYKMSGDFTLRPSSQRWILDDNELVYVGTIVQRVKVRITASLTSGNNNQVGMYVTYVDYDTGTPEIIDDSENYTTTNGSGKSEVNDAETVLEVKYGDRIYPSLENKTAVQNITAVTAKMFISPFR